MGMDKAGLLTLHAKSSVEEVIKLAKLMDVRGRLIRNLSKGYRQRVGLAQAMLGFPDIIILDEPTVGLDPKQIIEIRELIRKLAKDHTVILSSHILAEVREVCDYIMIISKGRLVASDTPDNLEHLMDEAESVEILAKTEPSNLRDILNPIRDIIRHENRKESGRDNICSIGSKRQQRYPGTGILCICRGRLSSSYAEYEPCKSGGDLPGTDTGGNRLETAVCKERGGGDRCWRFIREN